MYAVVLFVGFLSGALVAQTPAAPPNPKQLYEAGRYQQVVEAVAAAREAEQANPSMLYLAALSHERLEQRDRANQIYSELAGREENDPWRFIGESALRAHDEKQRAEALGAANRAVELGPNVAEAHYQRGLVLAHRDDFTAAGEAFEKATAVDPTFAYAYYYAGIAFQRAKRTDKMANNFERFLKLAPNAPERSQVESTMRTVRGRR
jgi:tetratricopeptide (TPR) repeat protein